MGNAWYNDQGRIVVLACGNQVLCPLIVFEVFSPSNLRNCLNFGVFFSVVFLCYSAVDGHGV
jgi:hypothetical protein